VKDASDEVQRSPNQKWMDFEIEDMPNDATTLFKLQSPVHCVLPPGAHLRFIVD